MNLHSLQHDFTKVFGRWKIDDGERLQLEPWAKPAVQAMADAGRYLLHGKPQALQRIFLEWGRGHGKSLLIAAKCAWLLLCSKRPIHGICCAADQDQAALVRDAIETLVRMNQVCRMLEVQKERVLNPLSGSTLRIMSSDIGSSFGVSPHYVVADEFCHWEPKAEGLWHSLLSSAAKKDRCLMLIISNAGFMESWQHQVVESIKRNDKWFYHRLDGPAASWITADRLKEQRELLPTSVYARLWQNVWSSGAGDALESHVIERSVKLQRLPDADHKSWAWVCGIDLGLRQDKSAVVCARKHVGSIEEIEHPAKLSEREMMLIDAELIDEPPGETEITVDKATGNLELGEVYHWSPDGGEVDLSEIELRVLQLHQQLRFTCVAYDPWQSVYLAQRLSEKGLPMLAVPFSSQNLRTTATEVLSAFRNDKVALWRNEELLRDLQAMRVEERSYGVRLTFPRDQRGHGDVATAFSLALFAAKDAEHKRPQRIQGELLVG